MPGFEIQCRFSSEVRSAARRCPSRSSFVRHGHHDASLGPARDGIRSDRFGLSGFVSGSAIPASDLRRYAPYFIRGSRGRCAPPFAASSGSEWKNNRSVGWGQEWSFDDGLAVCRKCCSTPCEWCSAAAAPSPCRGSQGRSRQGGCCCSRSRGITSRTNATERLTKCLFSGGSVESNPPSFERRGHVSGCASACIGKGRGHHARFPACPRAGAPCRQETDAGQEKCRSSEANSPKERRRSRRARARTRRVLKQILRVRFDQPRRSGRKLCRFSVGRVPSIAPSCERRAPGGSSASARFGKGRGSHRHFCACQRAAVPWHHKAQSAQKEGQVWERNYKRGRNRSECANTRTRSVLKRIFEIRFKQPKHRRKKHGQRY